MKSVNQISTKGIKAVQKGLSESVIPRSVEIIGNQIDSFLLLDFQKAIQEFDTKYLCFTTYSSLMEHQIHSSLLVYLEISCSLSQLPSTFSSLKNLRVLNLSHNLFLEVPDLSSFKELKYLNLSSFFFFF